MPDDVQRCTSLSNRCDLTVFPLFQMHFCSFFVAQLWMWGYKLSMLSHRVKWFQFSLLLMQLWRRKRRSQNIQHECKCRFAPQSVWAVTCFLRERLQFCKQKQNFGVCVTSVYVCTSFTCTCESSRVFAVCVLLQLLFWTFFLRGLLVSSASVSLRHTWTEFGAHDVQMTKKASESW